MLVVTGQEDLVQPLHVTPLGELEGKQLLAAHRRGSEYRDLAGRGGHRDVPGRAVDRRELAVDLVEHLVNVCQRSGEVVVLSGRPGAVDRVEADVQHAEDVRQVDPVPGRALDVDAAVLVGEQADVLHHRALAAQHRMVRLQPPHRRDRRRVEQLARRREVVHERHLNAVLVELVEQLQHPVVLR